MADIRGKNKENPITYAEVVNNPSRFIEVTETTAKRAFIDLLSVRYGCEYGEDETLMVDKLCFNNRSSLFFVFRDTYSYNLDIKKSKGIVKRGVTAEVYDFEGKLQYEREVDTSPFTVTVPMDLKIANIIYESKHEQSYDEYWAEQKNNNSTVSKHNLKYNSDDYYQCSMDEYLIEFGSIERISKMPFCLEIPTLKVDAPYLYRFIDLYYYDANTKKIEKQRRAQEKYNEEGRFLAEKTYERHIETIDENDFAYEVACIGYQFYTGEAFSPKWGDTLLEKYGYVSKDEIKKNYHRYRKVTGVSKIIGAHLYIDKDSIFLDYEDDDTYRLMVKDLWLNKGNTQHDGDEYGIVVTVRQYTFAKNEQRNEIITQNSYPNRRYSFFGKMLKVESETDERKIVLEEGDIEYILANKAHEIFFGKKYREEKADADLSVAMLLQTPEIYKPIIKTASRKVYSRMDRLKVQSYDKEVTFLAEKIVIDDENQQILRCEDRYAYGNSKIYLMKRVQSLYDMEGRYISTEDSISDGEPLHVKLGTEDYTFAMQCFKDIFDSKEFTVEKEVFPELSLYTIRNNPQRFEKLYTYKKEWHYVDKESFSYEEKADGYDVLKCHRIVVNYDNAAGMYEGIGHRQGIALIKEEYYFDTIFGQRMKRKPPKMYYFTFQGVESDLVDTKLGTWHNKPERTEFLTAPMDYYTLGNMLYKKYFGHLYDPERPQSGKFSEITMRSIYENTDKYLMEKPGDCHIDAIDMEDIHKIREDESTLVLMLKTFHISHRGLAFSISELEYSYNETPEAIFEGLKDTRQILMNCDRYYFSKIDGSIERETVFTDQYNIMGYYIDHHERSGKRTIIGNDNEYYSLLKAAYTRYVEKEK